MEQGTSGALPRYLMEVLTTEKIGAFAKQAVQGNKEVFIISYGNFKVILNKQKVLWPNLKKYIITLSEKNKYYVSEIGKRCNFNIVSEKGCRDAAKQIYGGRKTSNPTYAILNKERYPRGCIFNGKNPFQPVVHWNPEGKVESLDKQIQTICKNAPYKKSNPKTLRSKYFISIIY